MKSARWFLLTALAFAGAPAWSQGSGPTDPQIAAIVVAANQADIDAGKLAESKTHSKDVKAFAQQMVTDHTKMNNELHTLATQKNVNLPADMDQEHQQAMQKVASKQGADLDKAYVRAMVKHHSDALGAFQDAANDATDADVKAFAARNVPVLQEHLRMALNLDKSINGAATADADKAAADKAAADKAGTDKDK